MRVEHYEILEPIGKGDDWESFNARDLSTLREVIVHTVRPPLNSPSSKTDLIRLGSALFGERRPPSLLFAGEREGTFYIVTESKAECKDIRKWLEQQPAPVQERRSEEALLSKAGVWKVPPVENKRASTAVPPSEPESFTRMFSGGGATPAQAPAASVEPPSEPGSFTRMFSPGGATPAQAPAASAEPSFEPEGFTRMFSGGGATPAQAPAAPAEPSSEPESFPRMFSGGGATPAQAPAAPAEPSSEPEGFTRMFSPGGATPAQAPAASAEPSSEPGSFTRMFSAGGATPAQAPAPSAEPSSEPGNFTRMFSTAPQPQESSVIFKTTAEPAAPPSSEPSDFTRMFRPGSIAQPKIDASFGSAPPPADGGVFTGFFQTGRLPESPVGETATAPGGLTSMPPAPAVLDVTGLPKTQPGDFTRPFATPVVQKSFDDSLSQPAFPSVSPPATFPGISGSAPRAPEAATGIFKTEIPNPEPIALEPSGPSDYTRMFAVPMPAPAPVAAPVAPAVPAPAPPIAAAPAPPPTEDKSAPPAQQASTPSYLPLILILNVLFLAALALILYLVLKK